VKNFSSSWRTCTIQQKRRRLPSGAPTSGEKEREEDGSNSISHLDSPQFLVWVRKTGDYIENSTEKHVFSA